MELEELMSEVLTENKHQVDYEFYRKKFYYSYSSLSKLLWNPQVFHQMYVLGIRDEKTEQHLVQGKLIHLLLLEPEKFDKEFMMSPVNLPTGNARIVLDTVFRHCKEANNNADVSENLEDCTSALLEVMMDLKYFQNLKTDQQRIEKMLTPDHLSYWDFLKKKKSKTLVDVETYKFCVQAVNKVKTHKDVMQLLGADITEFDNRQVINEEPFLLDLPSKNYGLKGIIDNLVIDHDAKIIYINDIKTTGKDLKDFSESVEYYSYWIQAMIYTIAVTFKYASLLDQGYQLKFHFVVIDRMYQTYAFPVTEQTLNTWLERFNKVLEQAEWHYINRSYDLPYEFAKGDVTL